MIAVKRLQSLIWVILVALGALGAYMVSLKVATERNELMRVRSQIAATKADIRYLETEFSARASMRQLESWNQHDFLYATPTAQQYLEGERALAQLDGVQPNGPDYVAPPIFPPRRKRRRKVQRRPRFAATLRSFAKPTPPIMSTSCPSLRPSHQSFRPGRTLMCQSPIRSRARRSGWRCWTRSCWTTAHWAI